MIIGMSDTTIDPNRVRFRGILHGLKLTSMIDCSHYVIDMSTELLVDHSVVVFCTLCSTIIGTPMGQL